MTIKTHRAGAVERFSPIHFWPTSAAPKFLLLPQPGYCRAAGLKMLCIIPTQVLSRVGREEPRWRQSEL